jgi:hypothetical protein
VEGDSLAEDPFRLSGMVMVKASDNNTLDPGSFSFYHNMACRKTPAKPVRIVNSFGDHLQFANSIL